MPDIVIHQLFPSPLPDGGAAPGVVLGGALGAAADAHSRALDDDDLIRLYSPADRSVPRVRANFIASIDGSATAAGLSGGLGAPADKRVFDLLRRLADVVVVGAGTVRSEGYGALRMDADAAAWRRAHGLAAHPTFAIVSGSLRLDPASAMFTEAPVRPLIFTVDSATGSPADRQSQVGVLSEVADVIVCGETTLDASGLVGALVARGLPQIHCEGGPSLLGALTASDVLDELCLTVSPMLEGGDGPRISHATRPMGPRAMVLDLMLHSGSMTLSKYSRDRASDSDRD